MNIINRVLTGLATGVVACGAGQFLVRRMRRFDFQGRNVLITGGSRGLGLLLARELAKEKARIAICARDVEELRRAEEDIASHGGQALAVQCDVTDRNAVENMVHTIRQLWGGIDVLINNAGKIQVGPQPEMTPEEYDSAMDIHFKGALNTIHAVLSQMKKRGEGRIVNISSIGGRVSIPHLLPYCASKFALVGLSEGLRAELIKYGIYVTTVCPGLMRTGSNDQAEFKGKAKQEYAAFASSNSYPPLSMNAERAASQILTACRDGRADLVLSLPAKLATLIHGLAPGITADALGFVNRLLPNPGGKGTESVKGKEARPHWMPSWLTRLNDKAAQRNNEITSTS